MHRLCRIVAPLPVILHHATGGCSFYVTHCGHTADHTRCFGGPFIQNTTPTWRAEETTSRSALRTKTTGSHQSDGWKTRLLLDVWVQTKHPSHFFFLLRHSHLHPSSLLYTSQTVPLSLCTQPAHSPVILPFSSCFQPPQASFRLRNQRAMGKGITMLLCTHT